MSNEMADLGPLVEPWMVTVSWAGKKVGFLKAKLYEYPGLVGHWGKIVPIGPDSETVFILARDLDQALDLAKQVGIFMHPQERILDKEKLKRVGG